MSTLLGLPYEILAQIVNPLLLPDLESLSAVSPTLAGACEKALLEEQRLKNKYSSVDQATSWRSKDADRRVWPDIFSFWDEIARLGVTSYIEELKLEDLRPHGEYKAVPYLLHNALDPLEVSALRCPFVRTEEVDTLLKSAVDGSDDAVLAILLPQLSNLKHLRIPADYWCSGQSKEDFHWTTTIISRIAKASSARPAALPNLHIVDCSMATEICSVDLDRFAPFLALTTVHKLVLQGCTQDNFIWPESLPKSHVQEIVLHSSTVTSTALEGLVNGILGPCTIRQTKGSRWPGLGFPKGYKSFTFCEIKACGEVLQDGGINEG